MRTQFIFKFAVFLTLVAASGCSWIFVKPPPPQDVWPRVGWAECSDSKVAPVLDTIFAASGVIGAVQTSDSTARLSSLLGAGLWGLSAWYGYSNTAKCAEFQELKHHSDWVPAVPGQGAVRVERLGRLSESDRAAPAAASSR